MNNKLKSFGNSPNETSVKSPKKLADEKEVKDEKETEEVKRQPSVQCVERINAMEAKGQNVSGYSDEENEKVQEKAEHVEVGNRKRKFKSLTEDEIPEQNVQTKQSNSYNLGLNVSEVHSQGDNLTKIPQKDVSRRKVEVKQPAKEETESLSQSSMYSSQSSTSSILSESKPERRRLSRRKSLYDTDVCFKAEYKGARRTLKFGVTTKYQIPLAQSLKTAIKEGNKHPQKKKYSRLEITLKNEGKMELINPKALSGFFKDQKLSYKFRDINKVSDESCRDHEKDIKREWFYFIIDQTAPIVKVPALLFSYTGLIRVYGYKGERLVDAINKDGRFISNITSNRLFMDEDECEVEWNGLMENLEGKTLVLNNCKNNFTPKMSEPKSATDIKPNPKEHVKSEETKKKGTILDVSKVEDSRISTKTSISITEGDFDGTFEKLVKTISDRTKLDWTSVFSKKKDSLSKGERKKISTFIQKFASKRDEKSSFSLTEKLNKFGKYVCHIQYPGDASLNQQHMVYYGTGFCVGVITKKRNDYPVILTCCHVAQGFEHCLKDQPVDKTSCFVSFNYHEGKSFSNAKKFAIFQNGILAKNPEFDYALVVLEHNEELLKYLEKVHLIQSNMDVEQTEEKMECDDDDDLRKKENLKNNLGLGHHIRMTAVGEAEMLKLIGHPAVESKKVDSLQIISDPESEINLAIRESGLEFKQEDSNSEDMKPDRMFYHCSSFGGASGSPCFDEHGQLACMHAAGFFMNLDRDRNELKKPSVLEIGIPLKLIYEDLKCKIEKEEVQNLDLDDLYKLFPFTKPSEDVTNSNRIFSQ